jgi:cation:H+ antiporter
LSLAVLVALFLVCAVAIARAGYVLSATGDALAEIHGWGRGWVGLALLATVTSLPELAAGISAVAWVGAPNLAVGNALGACVFNLAFLVVVDALQRHQPIYVAAGATHLLSAAFGVVMLGFVAMSLSVGDGVPAMLHLGVYSPVLLALYLLALRSVHAHERAARATVAHVDGPRADPRPLWRRFAAAAAIVLVAGVALPHVAEALALALGVSRSVAGTLMMAAVTTLPEAAVTLGALRIGALDLAIGNLLGSNLFNVTILAVDDVFYRGGPLLADASPVHAGTAISAVVMTGLVIVGLLMRPHGRVLRVTSWISIGLLGVYLLNAMVVAMSAG